MKIYFISPMMKSTPLLFETMLNVFELADSVEDCDCVFFDLYSGLGEYNSNVIYDVFKYSKPVAVFDATDYGAMSKEKWNGFNMFGQNQVIYFMRKMDKTLDYPSWVYPYEVIMYPDHDFIPVSKEELFNRSYDICWVGNSSPTRRNVVNELQKHFNMIVHWTDEDGKIAHNEWLSRHRQAKFFLSADGGGFSDERAYQLYSIAPMIKNANNHLQLHPIPAIEIEENPTETDINLIKAFLTGKNISYSIYTEAIDHMKKYYTAEYRANYILETLRANNIF